MKCGFTGAAGWPDKVNNRDFHHKLGLTFVPVKVIHLSGGAKG
jgi:hypothetical protein